MSSGAAAPVAAGGVVLMLAMTAFIAVWSEEESTTTCTVDGTDTVLVGAVAPSTTSAAPAAATGASGQRVMPLAEGTYTVSSGFGPREGGDHMGVDLAAPEGTPIFAATDGVVVAAGAASGFGHWIVIDTTDESGKALSTVYGHMYASGVKVQVGQTVSAGQHIADVGNDGQSTGAHLHFEVVPGGRLTGGSQIDPMPWLAGAATTDGSGTGPGSGGGGTTPSCPPGFGTPGGSLDTSKVPEELAPWFQKAGSLCTQVSASLLAAQAQQESGFQRGLTSPAGAQGLTQFLPGTAASLAPDGQPYLIDADGNGAASIWDDGDAIMAQGRYMCAIASQIEQWKSEGKVSGDTTSLILAAYNAGEGRVLEYGGVPPYEETTNYVRIITEAEPGFRSAGSTGRFIPSPNGELGSQTVAAARQWLGTPYVWGGGNTSGPTNGGFDCSGLTSAAVFAASGGTVTLPRTSEQQWATGVEIPMDQVQAGDLVFSNWSADGQPGHVGIAIGGGRMIHAPQSGESVTEADVPADAKARRVM